MTNISTTYGPQSHVPGRLTRLVLMVLSTQTGDPSAPLHCLICKRGSKHIIALTGLLYGWHKLTWMLSVSRKTITLFCKKPTKEPFIKSLHTLSTHKASGKISKKRQKVFYWWIALPQWNKNHREIKITHALFYTLQRLLDTWNTQIFEVYNHALL